MTDRLRAITILFECSCTSHCAVCMYMLAFERESACIKEMEVSIFGKMFVECLIYYILVHFLQY